MSTERDAEMFLHMIAPAIKSGTSVLIIAVTTTPADIEGKVMLAYGAATAYKDSPGRPALVAAVQSWLCNPEKPDEDDQ